MAGWSGCAAKRKSYETRMAGRCSSRASPTIVAESKLAEEAIRASAQQLEASLREKEILLREIHHRVKNNLQVISSLLRLQSAHIRDPAMLEMFNESRNRVLSMALVHEKLYQSPDLCQVDFSEYPHSLTALLIRSSGPRGAYHAEDAA